MTVSAIIGVFVKIFFLLTPFFVLSVYVTLTRGEEEISRRKLAARTTIAVLVIAMVLYLFGEQIFRYLGITLDAFRIGSGIVLLLSGIEVVRGSGIPTGVRQSNDDGDISVVPLAIPYTVGPGTVGTLLVMGAGASGILLHEAMGHAFEADFNRKGQSVFSGKMGQKVCDSSISIVDDGTIPGNRGACYYDDEGVPGQKTYMVKDGILNSYLHDRISAKWYGVSPTGNGRRESFRYNPIPRMRATYMESGTASPEDIIASVRKGIYVDEFSNGQVKIGEGDFTFYVKSGYMIEDGKLTAPVKDINIIGNGPQALADIVCVGNDMKIDNGTWTCGKEQSVPVSCGIPTVMVKSLTVGGE